MSKKKQVIQEIMIDINYDALSTVISKLQDALNKYGDQTVSIESYEEYGSWYTKVCIFCYREETDAEYDERVVRENNFLESRRRQYENLKKEFEK